MPRDARAYLADIIESCDAIAAALSGVDLQGYRADRLVRSAVEREFTIIGEAVTRLVAKRSGDLSGGSAMRDASWTSAINSPTNTRT